VGSGVSCADTTVTIPNRTAARTLMHAPGNALYTRLRRASRGTIESPR
jgi:hypothetical protein